MMKVFQRLALLLALFSLAQTDIPVEMESTRTDFSSGDARFTDYNYRLPEVLDPIHYDIEITPYFESTINRESFTFDGTVDITVTALEDDISQLVIQENVREVLSVQVTDMDNSIIPLDLMSPFQRDRQYQFLRINLRNGVTLNKDQRYKISVVYIGNMNETPLSRGVFRGSYVNKITGKQHWYAATHLQPTHSRQAFPSFDEPGFKSTFTIIINRPVHFTDTYSNMPLVPADPDTTTDGLRVREQFETTPRMAAYLVTFHISEEFTVIADNNDPEKSYRILARPDAAGQGEYALEVGVKLTKWLDDYFNIPYYDMIDNIKNDQIASPDWASGATENWGLVTYRELRLLYEEGQTNALDKMSIATITAHELAHKWFGNLITARWWDNVWINEGYASYFEYFAMHEVDPSLELEDQFNIMYVQSALSADSSINTRALQHTVNSPAEVTGHFSGISYSKGASLLMMLKHFLTPDTFQHALRLFLLDSYVTLNLYCTFILYEHAFPEDIYKGFATAVEEHGVLANFPDVNITQFLEIWVNEPGFPVLNVNVDIASNRIILEQERFYLTPDAVQTTQVWPLPLTYTTQSNPDWNNRRANHVMIGKTYSIEQQLGDEWVIFNVKQNGIYRVNYNPHNWELIGNALQNNRLSIDALNRAQIVDDIFAFMRSERMTYESGFKVLQFLRNETNYYVWYPAITGFTFLRNRLLHLPDKLSEYDTSLFEFLAAVIGDLDYDEGQGEVLTRILNRFFVMSFACSVGHSGCVQHAVQTFNSAPDIQSINPNIRRHVYCSGLLAGDLQTWNTMHMRRRASNNQADEVVLLRALGCTTNALAINQYLNMVLSNEVRAQDRVNAFTFLYMGARDNAKVALQYIKIHHNDIREAVVGSVRFNTVLSNLASYLDEEGLNDMEQWLRNNVNTIPEYSVGMSAIQSARNNMAWGTQRADEILRGLRGSSNAIFPATLLLFVAFVISQLTSST